MSVTFGFIEIDLMFSIRGAIIQCVESVINMELIFKMLSRYVV